MLIAEQFDARDGDLCRERLVEVAEVCTTASYNALEVDRLPLGWLCGRWARRSSQSTAHLTALGVRLLAAWRPPSRRSSSCRPISISKRPARCSRSCGAMSSRRAAAWWTKCSSSTAPTSRPASRSCGSAIRRSNSNSKRVHGEMETAQRQLDAVRATQDQPGHPRRQSDRRLPPVGRRTRARTAAHQPPPRAGAAEPRARTTRRHQPDRRPRADVGHRPSTDRPAGRARRSAGHRGRPVGRLATGTRRAGRPHRPRAGRSARDSSPICRSASASVPTTASSTRATLTEVCQTADVGAEAGATPSPTVLVNVALDTPSN